MLCFGVFFINTQMVIWPSLDPAKSTTGITGDVFGIGIMPDISDEPPTVVDGEIVE